MSGGSYDYVYSKVQQIDIRKVEDPDVQKLREAFQEHLNLVAEALHDIEWVDSCDYGAGDEVRAIRAVLALPEKKDERSLAELHREALQVQDAVNLSGVVHSFSRTMHRLRELVPGKDTEFYNRHPIAILFSSKIADLTGSDSVTASNHAYDECERYR